MLRASSIVGVRNVKHFSIWLIASKVICRGRGGDGDAPHPLLFCDALQKMIVEAKNCQTVVYLNQYLKSENQNELLC